MSKKIGAFIDKIYKSHSGFGLKHTDKAYQLSGNKDVFTTYGELLPSSVSKLINHLNIDGNDVFYDFGSGTGKVVAQMYIETPVKKAVGIEISDDRYNISTQIKEKLKNEFYSKHKRIKFINDNFLNVDTTDGTIFYMCSTCFSDDLMNKLHEKMTKSPNLKTVITLKPLTNSEIQPTELSLPTSWSRNGSSCYVYDYTTV